MARRATAPRGRFWLEVALAAVAAALAALTLVTREWVELLTGWDPDRGSGALEWAVVIGCAALALGAALLARLEWARAATGPADQGA